MSYVLVPVPDEFVADVEQFLFQLRLREDLAPFDEDAMAEHLLSLDEEPRSIMLTIAEAVVQKRPYSDVELAELLGVSVRELLGLLTDINDVRVRSYAGNLVFTERATDEDDPTRTVRRLQMLLGYALAAVQRGKLLGFTPLRARSSESSDGSLPE